MATPEEVEKLKRAYEKAKKRYEKALDTEVEAYLAYKKVEATFLSIWKEYLKAKDKYEAVLGTEKVNKNVLQTSKKAGL